MRKATRSDEALVVDIISYTFDTNPGVNWMLRKRGNHGRMIKRMAAYAFIKAFVRDGVYISSNEKGVALCYKYNYHTFSLSELFYELRYGFETFHYWEDRGKDIKFWFMKWDTEKNIQ